MVCLEMNSTPKNTARFAGLLYLLVALSAPFSMMYVPSIIVVPGDPAATASHLVASQSLFRLGLLNDGLIALLEVALTAVLYVLLRPAGKTLALVATFARLGMAVLQAVNLFPALAALELVKDSPSLAVVMLQVHERGSHVWELFFGLHCFVMAALVFRSGYFPRVFAGLMAFAALGYSSNAIGNLVVPASAPLLASFVGIAALVGEVPFVFWLLFKGLDEPRWRQAQQQG
jgi:hypothetical protein